MSAAFNPLGGDPAKMDERHHDVQRRLQLSLGSLLAGPTLREGRLDSEIKPRTISQQDATKLDQVRQCPRNALI
jgi:hypothetical protein